jgi:ubiquinone/menaquinone biosynthesis C-methylase UbiE
MTRMPREKVNFGYRTIDAEEKKKLVHDQFTPIARTYDRADALLSLGLHFK